MSTQKVDYSEFDAALLALIAGGCHIFSNLDVSLQSRARAFCTEQQQPFRVVDRRLQALRKKGLVNYKPKTGWRVTKIHKVS